jgi:hypothetical protein
MTDPGSARSRRDAKWALALAGVLVAGLAPMVLIRFIDSTSDLVHDAVELAVWLLVAAFILAGPISSAPS